MCCILRGGRLMQLDVCPSAVCRTVYRPNCGNQVLFKYFAAKLALETIEEYPQ